MSYAASEDAKFFLHSPTVNSTNKNARTALQYADEFGYDFNSNRYGSGATQIDLFDEFETGEYIALRNLILGTGASTVVLQISFAGKMLIDGISFAGFLNLPQVSELPYYVRAGDLVTVYDNDSVNNISVMMNTYRYAGPSEN